MWKITLYWGPVIFYKPQAGTTQPCSTAHQAALVAHQQWDAFPTPHAATSPSTCSPGYTVGAASSQWGVALGLGSCKLHLWWFHFSPPAFPLGCNAGTAAPTVPKQLPTVWEMLLHCSQEAGGLGAAVCRRSFQLPSPAAGKASHCWYAMGTTQTMSEWSWEGGERQQWHGHSCLALGHLPASWPWCGHRQSPAAPQSRSNGSAGWMQPAGHMLPMPGLCYFDIPQNCICATCYRTIYTCFHLSGIMVCNMILQLTKIICFLILYEPNLLYTKYSPHGTQMQIHNFCTDIQVFFFSCTECS